jgi:hypothetical protein
VDGPGVAKFVASNGCGQIGRCAVYGNYFWLKIELLLCKNKKFYLYMMGVFIFQQFSV